MVLFVGSPSLDEVAPLSPNPRPVPAQAQPLLVCLELLLCATAAACGDEHHEPNLLDHLNRHAVKAGVSYALAFDREIDQYPVGHVWYGDNLADSPLAFMERTPIVIKADDYGGPIDSNSCRFIEMVDRFGGFVSLGIITSLLAEREIVNQTYRDLHRQGFEAWLHGHSHDWSPPAEFSGASLKRQEESFERGIELGREMLHVDFHTFGAPGNGIDGSTSQALRRFPQIAVWLFGDAGAPALSGSDAMVLPRIIDVEEKVGVVEPPASFSRALRNTLARKKRPNAMTLQVHPTGFGEADLDRLEAMLADIQQQRSFRYTAPFELWKWKRDTGNVALTKTGARSYSLDLSSAEFDHIIELDPAGPIRATFAQL